MDGAEYMMGGGEAETVDVYGKIGMYTCTNFAHSSKNMKTKNRMA